MPTETTGTASGRLGALGNHTDYNQGLVLAMGIEFNLEISATCSLRLNPKSDGSHIQQTLYRYLELRNSYDELAKLTFGRRGHGGQFQCAER